MIGNIIVLCRSETWYRVQGTQNCLKCNHSYPCKIWGFHGGDYEESRLLGWGGVKSPPDTIFYTCSGLLPAGPSPQTLPLSSLLISHVAPLPYFPALIQLCLFDSTLVCQPLITLVPRSRIFLFLLPWRWRWYVPPKRSNTIYTRHHIPEDGFLVLIPVLRVNKVKDS
jgi:hypothetical protein